MDEKINPTPANDGMGIKKSSFIMFFVGLGIVVVVAALAGDFKSPKQTASVSDTVQNGSTQNGERAPAPNEILVETLFQGAGEAASASSKLTVHYTGRLADGTEFDSSLNRNIPFEFLVGARSVIPCWDQGLIGAQAGAKLRLTCPPLAAYGETGVPNVIPPNATLTFDVEVLGVGAGSVQGAPAEE